MNIEHIRSYCFEKAEVTEDFPFGAETLVFKVMGKIFLIASLDEIPLRINLKCEPEIAIELRERYESVLPGYHMNKTHWNTVVLDGSVRPEKVYEWIDHSYSQVVKGLTKKKKEHLLKNKGNKV